MTLRFRQSEGLVSWKRMLQPQSVVFGVTLLHFLFTLIIVMAERVNPFIVDGTGFVGRAMTYPFLLLLSCSLLLIGRLATIALAMTIAGSLIYAIGYRGLVGVSYAHDVGTFTQAAWTIWFGATPTALIVQVALSAVICIVGAVQLSRLLLRSRKGSQ